MKTNSVNYFSIVLNTLILVSIALASTISEDVVLTAEEEKFIFVSDDIFQGIIPTINECWNLLSSSIERNTIGNTEYEKQIFWNEIMIKFLKKYHTEIRSIDAVILANQPSRVLNTAVNKTELNKAFNISEEVLLNKNIEWIETVKDGWIKVAGMMKQIHFKYDWHFDHIHTERRSKHENEDFISINETLKQYFLWYKIRDLHTLPESYSSDDIVNLSKEITTGHSGPQKNLFVGLKELLRLEGKRVSRMLDQQPSASLTCSGNETMAGKRGRIFRYVPIYVLLHLLNGEFKYYIMQNVGHMHRCVHFQECDFQMGNNTGQHLKTFYTYYFNEFIEAFKEKYKDPPTSSIPRNAWRWRCDPSIPPVDQNGIVGKRPHVEDVTFIRFYDYQTFFIAEEKDISLTKTCRESCDMFDGGYSSIPCEEDDWNCLEEEKDFDCWELKNQGIPCPGKARSICPNGGIKCTTSKMKKAKVCEGQRDWRHIEWLERAEEKFMGKQSECIPSHIKNYSTSVISERSGITKYEPQNCEICLCKCYEPLTQRTHRYISLLPQIADIENQYAVVGVKFVKLGGVIYPKIAQATVKYGKPNVSSIHWVDPKPVANLSDPNKIFRLGRNSKNILLDDLMAPVGYAITGLRFVTVNQPIRGDYEMDLNAIDGNSSENGPIWSFNKSIERELALEVHMTKLTELGSLNPEKTMWKSNAKNSSLYRRQIPIDDPDQPILTKLPSLTSSSPNQYISIQSTSIKKDVGQTPVPFFDAQELIESTNVTLLRGLGIFYKTQIGYGGFLGFRIISMPLSDAPQNPRYDLWHSKRFKY